MNATPDIASINTLKDRGGNWLMGQVGGFEVQAKVFTEPSSFGMELDRRISKLWVALPGTPRTVLYNYDRGLDVNHLKDDALAEIVKAVGSRIK
jgi:hypothetical protein